MTTTIADGQTSDLRPSAFSYLRFSSAEQVKDAKTADQIGKAKEWADENGYRFSETSFRDLGVSAYQGDNSSIGDLARFLEAVEGGMIPRGSALIIEALDRLSRENQWKGQMLLGSILSKGVDVVTLNDDQKYTFEDLQHDMGAAMRIILAFNLAHQESLQKSKRVRSGWKRNTEAVKEGKRLRSSLCPSWLRLVGTLDDGHFEIIEGKAQIVREVFERYGAGQSTNAIARDLRERGIPSLKGGQWIAGNIMRVVRSKAPYGILELGKGKKQGHEIFDQVDDYFPVIIDDKDLKARVKARMDRLDKGPAKGIATRKVKTQGILTGVIWSNEITGGNRAVCKKKADGTRAYVDYVTHRWVGAKDVIERPLIEGWSEVVAAFQTDTTPEIEGAEAALEAAEGTLEFAERRGSERLIEVAQEDVGEAQRVLKELRKNQALMLQDIPGTLEGLEPWEANEVVRRVVERVDVVRGEGRREAAEGEDKRAGKLTMLVVRMRNGATLRLGDLEVLFQE